MTGVVWIVSGALAVALMLGNPDNPAGVLIGVIVSGCVIGILDRPRPTRFP
jgi:hypothetical protein